MRRVTELDALRGLAALSIAAYHLWFPKLFYGWTRVDLFFVLSGYLVTSVILRKSGGRGFYRTFFVRRGLRIWPTYFLALVGLAAVNPFLPTPAPLEALGNYLTFTQNLQYYWSDESPAFSPHFFHTWSLALEVRFYLLWPLAAALCGRRGLFVLAPAMAVGSALARTAGASPYILAGRADGFALGALLAAMLLDRERLDRPTLRRLARGFAATGVAAGAFLAWGMAANWDRLTEQAVPWPGPSILASNALAFALVGLLICGSGHPALAPLRDRRLVYLGTISYGLYLFHPIVFKVVELAGRGLGLERGPALEALMIPASVAAAALSWELVERPLGRLKEGVRYAPPSPAGDADAPPRPADALAVGSPG